jgi:hypothetical protein
MPTVISKIDLRVSRSIDLLGRLKQTTTEFAKKEDQITRDFRTRNYVATRKWEIATEKIRARYEAEIADGEAAFAAEENRIRAIYDRRLARVQKIHAFATRNLPKRAEEVKGSWLGTLQMRRLRAERTVKSDSQTLEAAFAQFSSSLLERRAALEALEQNVAKSFRGHAPFVAMLTQQAGADSEDSEELFNGFQAHLATAEQKLAAFQQVIPKGIMGMLGGGFSKAPVQAAAAELATETREARRLHDRCCVVAQTKFENDRQQIRDEFDRTIAEIDEQWNRADEVEHDFARRTKGKLEAQLPRLTEKIAQFVAPKLGRVAANRTASVEHSRAAQAEEERTLTAAHQTEMAAIAATEKALWAQLESDWQREIVPLYKAIEEMNAETAPRTPEWTPQFVENWTPPADFTPSANFGRLKLDLSLPVEGVPPLTALALPGPSQVSIPLALAFPEQGSLLFETTDSGEATVVGTINNIILRLLSNIPPGKLSITIIDPVGLGQNFAGVMHLSDYEESLINRRIWTQRDHIEERLSELNVHIEKVIQMYLRNEYATITEYNKQAGSVAEKYHFLIVGDFPANFSETAATRLQSIAISGPRCGVYMLIHWDQRQSLPDGFAPDELRKTSVCVRSEKNEFILNNVRSDANTTLEFDSPPNPDLAVRLIHKIGKNSIDSNRVEVPFTQVAPKPGEMWTNDTTSELRVAIGRTGATKLQYLAIGKGTRQHALFAGKTGSGKSTLFHIIITNLALSCSPDQVEFYLIDFKKGVEFKCYASRRLPHAKVIAIESDREFALSVLQRLDDELKRRGDMFRKLGVQDLAGYKREGGTEPMPRALLLIDEFQEFFVEDDTIAQGASLLFDRIVRQGRAFGIHVLLGSQSLGGAYTLARATLGQMAIRVALQCNEADAYLIMDESNSAPRLLSRPGEGIYNDAGGAIEGNSPFQVVWLSDQERDEWLDKVTALAAERHEKRPGPIVFEGNAPSDIRENDLLRILLDSPATVASPAGRCWLGAPNSIKGPTEASFHHQSGNHLLIVGQRDEAAVSMLGLSLIALASQYPIGAVKIVLLNSAAPDSPESEFLDRILKAIPHEIATARGHEIGEVMNELAAEYKARNSGEVESRSAPPVYLFINGLHRFKKLRQEDDFSFGSGDSESTGNPGAQLSDIISEGSAYGMHIITTVDTLNNVNRSMSRKALTEFEMRVVFQMSANDSASLIDSPKASTLGLYRALYYNEHEGTLETFRPYALPDSEWIRQAGEKLAKLRG